MPNGQALMTLISKQFSEAIFYQETSRKSLALTIDDVPSRDDNSGTSIQRFLDIIEQYNQSFKTNVKVTFFVTTNHLQGNVKIIEEIVNKGHEIGNHGTTDHRHANLSQYAFENEFKEAHDLLVCHSSQPIRWFRPGQAFYNPGMVKTLKTTGQQLGYQNKFALASMIPFDTYKFFNHPNLTLENLKRFTFPGSILVLHGGNQNQVSNTVKVLQKLLPHFHQKGYELMTLSEQNYSALR